MSGVDGSTYILECALLCFFSGFLLAALYTVLQMLRVIFGIRWLGTVILDILFCTIAVFVIYLVAFAMSKGQLRFFQIAVSLIGFCVFMLILYPVFMYPTKKVYKMVTRFSLWLAAKYRGFFKKKKDDRRKRRKNAKKRTNKCKKSKKRLEKLM